MEGAYRSTDTCVQCGRKVDPKRVAVGGDGYVCPVCEAEEKAPAPPAGRWLGLAIIGIVLLAGGAALGWYFLRDPSPTRVFVVVGGGSNATQDVIRGWLVEGLRDLGFAVGPTTESAVVRTSDVAAAVEAAEDEDARYVVHVTLETIEERPGLRQGRLFMAVQVRTQVLSVMEDEAPGPVHTVTFGTEGIDQGEALQRLEDEWAAMSFAYITADLFAQSAVQKTIEDLGGPGELHAAAKLRGELTNAHGQRRTQERFQSVCRSLTDGLVPEAERDGVRCVTSACDEQYVWGISPDGRYALVHVESPAVYVPFAGAALLRKSETIESLELRALDGSESRVLAYARNFYGYGDIARNGSTVVFVEDGDALGLVALDVQSGQRRILNVVQRPTRLLQPRISDDGRYVVFYQRSPVDPSLLKVMATSGEGEATVLGTGADSARWVALPLEVEGDVEQLVAMKFRSDVADPERGPHATLADPSNLDRFIRIGGLDHQVSEIAGADGEYLYLGYEDSDGECGVGRWHARTRELEWVPTRGCLRELQLTGDGRIVGTDDSNALNDVAAGDAEVVIVDVATGEERTVTANERRDRYPRAASAATRVAFERVVESPYASLGTHVAVCYFDAERL